LQTDDKARCREHHQNQEERHDQRMALLLWPSVSEL
jgi:hypothetical protein